MTAPVFVVPAADLAAATVGGIVRVTGSEGRHAITVRRLTVGEAVVLVDGAGNRAAGTIAAVVDKSTFDTVIGEATVDPVPVPRVVVVQALAKGDRGELAVELLTEIGVDVIVPWAATNCVSQWKGERVARGHQRWADAALAAAKQARRSRFPAVEPLATTGDVFERLRAAELALVLHESAHRGIAGVAVPDDGDVVIVVGPEGGLTAAELDVFDSAGATTVRLGPSVLRTSSAGMAAASIVLAATPRWSVEG